jgi:thiamine biosynthesis lipoprotein
MPYQMNSGMVFGTVYNISYECDSDLHQAIKAELQKVDNSLSPFNEHSVITAINQNQDVKPDEMFLTVFNKAMEISRETGGAFDITVAPLVNAWGFGFKNGSQPNRQQVDSLRRLIGYEKVTLKDDRIVKQSPDIMLDCSAIAKGYGSDVVARFLQQQGVKNFMVEIGGEVVTSGVNPQRLPWRIGVTKPTDDTLSIKGEIQSVLNVTDLAMATSGNYRNFYYKGGKKYAHTIDPQTGYPVQHSLLSATVLAKDCATADAYATSFMVLGIDGAKKVLERHPELMAYFIYADDKGQNAVWCSPSLKDKIVE